MKKIFLIILASFFILPLSPASALNLDKLVEAVDNSTSKDAKNPNAALSNIQDKLLKQVEDRINKVTERIESRVDKYEKKLDEYQKKIDQLEKVADQAISTFNSFDKNHLQEYISIAKYAVIGFVLMFVTSFLLSILVFFQMLKIKSLLKNKA